MKSYSFNLYWFIGGLFLLWLALIVEWATGQESSPKWLVVLFPILFGLMMNLFEWLYDTYWRK